jgi:hypothetical protein
MVCADPNGHNYGFFGPGVDTIKRSGINPRQIVGDLHAADGGACARDAHKPRMDCPSGVDYAREAIAGHTHSPYFGQSYANLETNIGLHDMGRALLEAADLNKWLSLPPPLSESLLVRTASFCMERSGHFDSWDLTDQVRGSLKGIRMWPHQEYDADYCCCDASAAALSLS